MTRILFVHPDLGIGGAERLVVDAAVALKSKGHDVSFVTNHHNPNHCFEETKNGTLPIITVGDWLPRNIFGKFYALCAYIRMIYASFYISFILSRQQDIDIIFCDIISLGIPIFRWAKNRPKVIFYCHFPDQLLSTNGSKLKQFYRMPLNYLEETTTGQADVILVNSQFTGAVFKRTFKSINYNPIVLHPSLNTKYFDNVAVNDSDIDDTFRNDAIIFLSINRYERKKNLPLAIKAFKELERKLTKDQWIRAQLVIAGGYDNRVTENIEHYSELVELAGAEDILDKILFIKSPSDKHKVWLLKRCQALVYTPTDEHFGIVPIEGMYSRKPVIAVNRGGPTETIIHTETGWLCDSDTVAFSNVMVKLFNDESLSERMGEQARKHVEENFSFESFSNKLNDVVQKLVL